MVTTLSRSEMEAVIRGGGSIMHQNRIITRVADLPTEGDLAEGDAAATQAALDGIAATRAALDEQERKLLASAGSTAAKGKATSKGKAGAAPTSDPNVGAGGTGTEGADTGADGATGATA